MSSELGNCSPVEIDKLRADLVAAEWTVDSVAALLGAQAADALARDQLVPALRVTAQLQSAAAILTRLFILAQPVSDEELRIAFPTANPQEIGLVADGKALVDLRPFAFESHDWWIASDLGQVQTGRAIEPEHVLGIGKATLSLMRMTIRERVGLALDLGTGCGILALCLATHCEQVVATDISSRACGFARFNAALNAIENIEVKEGSLFEPVAGLSFDLITSNPPFVITPESVRSAGFMEYRDGGMDRDNLIATVIRQAPAALTDGGILQMLANWEVRGDDWWSRPRGWISSDTQTWLVQRDLLTPASYVEMWMRDSGETQAAVYDQWLADFEGAGTTGIGMGFLALRKSTAGAFVAEEILEGELPDGQTVRAALDYLELPPQWKDMLIERASDVREERHYVPGATDPQVVFLTQGAGMARRIRVSSLVAALIGASDGELTPGQVIGALSVLTQTDIDEIESEIALALPALLRARIASLFDQS